jgi:hypothetical protein
VGRDRGLISSHVKFNTTPRKPPAPKKRSARKAKKSTRNRK